MAANEIKKIAAIMMNRKRLVITLAILFAFTTVGIFGVFSVAKKEQTLSPLPLKEVPLMDLTHENFIERENSFETAPKSSGVSSASPVTIGEQFIFTVSDDGIGIDYDETFVVVLDGTNGIILITKDAYDSYDDEYYHFANPIGDDSELWLRTEDLITQEQLEYMLDQFDNNVAMLPVYGEMELGFLAFNEEDDDLRIYWDETLNFSGKLSVRYMIDGTIEAMEFPENTVIIHTPETRVAVDYPGLATVDIVDYVHPENGAVPMIPLTSFFEEGNVTDASTCAFKIYGNDAFSNSDDNLMPYLNMTHAYFELTDRRIIIEEDWDTDECCWRVRDTIYMKGTGIE